MKIGIAQIKIIPGRPDLNAKNMLRYIQKAKKKYIDLIIFPELSIPGYLIGDIWEQEAFLRDCEILGKKIIAASKNLAIVFGNVAIDWKKLNDDGRVRKYNACFIAKDKKLYGNSNFPYPFRIKTLLPNYHEFDDSRHFYCTRKLAIELNYQPSDLLKSVYLPINNKILKLGFTICEDGWDENYSIQPINILCKKDSPDLLINISCSPFALNKEKKRNKIFSNYAKQHNKIFIYTNCIGIQNNGKTIYAFDGSSYIYSNRGEIIKRAASFKEELLIFDYYNKHTQIAYKEKKDIEEIYQTLIFCIKNFFKQIQKNKVVIGVSGGIDSAVTAALYSIVLDKTNILLVNMPSKFNSGNTKKLALQLAKNIGCNFVSIPINESVLYTVSQLNNSPIKNFTSDSTFNLKISSFAQENIQARDRSSRILAAIAASWEAVFTCNANKTEITIGYSTLYGDNSGFLAALADLWKYQVYELAEYLNKEIFKNEIIPQGSIDILPSAELSDKQNIDKGQGDPIVYPYHDYLFKVFVENRNRISPEDILLWYREKKLPEKLGCPPAIINTSFPKAINFINDLEYWWEKFTVTGIIKRIQSPPIIAISKRPFGFGLRESQCEVYFTEKYYKLKRELLKNENIN